MKNFLTQVPFAHRGLHDRDLPENSLAAFSFAFDNGYAVETDVQLTKDGVPVLFHDENLKRMTGADALVEETTFEELCTLTLSESAEHIPTLGSLLRLADGKPLLLELKRQRKHRAGDFLRAVVRELEDYGGDYAVQSFHPLYVSRFKKLRPDVPCGVLGMNEQLNETASLKDKIRFGFLSSMPFNKFLKPDFISYRLTDYPQPATEEFRGVKLAWVITSPEEHALARRYCDNIVFENYLP